MIPWVPAKQVPIKIIEEILQPSIESRQLTNGGPVVRKLEEFLHSWMEVDNDRAVIVCCNGAIGMHGLVNGIQLNQLSPIRWATSAFTFPCSSQGPLAEAKIVDIEEDQLDLTLIDSDQPSAGKGSIKNNGLIITNLFGHVSEIDRYLQWQSHVDSSQWQSHDSRRFLIFDNATVPRTFYRGKNSINYGDGSIVSLHHTKPIGFGEGGIIVVRRQFEQSVRKCLNFGFEITPNGVQWNRLGLNGKMSDISASWILGYLQMNHVQIESHHRKLAQEWIQAMKKIPGVELLKDFSDQPGIWSCLPIKIISGQPILPETSITIRKYYTPLLPLPGATKLFNQIVCFPLHLEVESIQPYIDLVLQMSPK